MAGIYNRHQYFDERRAGLALWADLLVALERGEDYNVLSIANRERIQLVKMVESFL